MDWICKNRETGEIVTVLSKVSATWESVVNYTGRDLVLRSMSVEEFDKTFENIVYDLSSVLPYISEAANVFPQIREVLYPLARKLDHNYFNIGDTVFVEKVTDSDMNRFMPRSLSENQAYVITDIQKDMSEVELYWLILRPVYISKDGIKAKSDESAELSVSLPYYKERVLAKDAAWFLKRYDKEY